MPPVLGERAAQRGAKCDFPAQRRSKALYWSAIVNGVVAAPIIVSMMLMASSNRVMGKFKISGTLYYLGWATAAAMGASVVVMMVTEFT